MVPTYFKAGAAKVKITPVLGTRINGDFITHFANYVHDDLYARALVLESGDTRIVFIIIDTCIIPEVLAGEFRKLIADTTRTPFSNILIASTHTHAAGSLADVHLGSIDVDYARSLPPKILAAVEQAVANLQPAVFGHTSIDVPEHVVCRRYFMKDGFVSVNPVSGQNDTVKTNPIGAESYIDKRVAAPDPQLSCLAVRSLEGEWISILANYSLHYVGDWDNGTISADYFGVFSSYLENQLGAGGVMTAMMTNGTSGDVNIWDFLKPDRYPTEKFAKSKMIGVDLAKKLIDSLDSIQWHGNPKIDAIYKKVPLSVEKPTAEDLAVAHKTVAATNYERINPDLPENIRSLYAREQLLISQYPDIITCPVQAFRIGDFYVGALAGEFFAETGLLLKETLKGKPYFTISMANGNIGYVPPQSQIVLGGYETWRCRYRCAQEDGEFIVRTELLKALSRLDNQ